MNETCYGKSDKTIIIKINRNILTLNLMNTKKYGSVAKEYDFVKPESHEVNDKLNDTSNDCRDKCFLSFDFGYVIDKNFKNIQNKGEGILSLKNGYMKIKTQFFLD